ncbi:MAG: hypothetical protein OES09_09860 [Gammaproteobacteria bacterium]|nr:hypothetical protein [Gammaproteobacteria bacterium]
MEITWSADAVELSTVGGLDAVSEGGGAARQQKVAIETRGILTPEDPLS